MAGLGRLLTSRSRDGNTRKRTFARDPLGVNEPPLPPTPLDHDQTFGHADVFAETRCSRLRIATFENG
jgi:hypothetical protein